MPYPQFDRTRIVMKPLAERINKKVIEQDRILPEQEPTELKPNHFLILETVDRILAAKEKGRPVMLTFGAHTIKNGLGPVLIALLEEGWITHMATNGAGIIHDWEFAFQGRSSEDVKDNVAKGQFGNWQETGFYINLALNIGAWEGKGYGEAVGAMIQEEGLTIPARRDLVEIVRECIETDPARAAAAADLIDIIDRFGLLAGHLAIPHPYKEYSVQAAAYRLGIPLTGHPMIGHDIIYNHPMNHGASIGRVALRDFLTFAESISRIDGGVYLSVGSAVMSPMIFEKSLSMSQNLAIQKGEVIENHYVLIVDLAESRWDWTQGEPPENSPDYYLRYNKSFSRMGGVMRYLQADNRNFLLALCHALRQPD